MNIKVEKVDLKDKEKLFKLVQFALYDGSQYINNEIMDNGEFRYTWFDNYFKDNDRYAYFITLNGKTIGIVLVNENLKFLKEGKSIAEFLILPMYRRKHIGKKVAFMIFDKFKCDFEVEPIKNNEVAYKFWKNVINEYTNGKYEIMKDGLKDVFVFKRR